MKPGLLLAAFVSILPLAAAATTPSDLTMDTNFNLGAGIVPIDFTDLSGGSDDRVVKIFPKSATLNSGFWAVVNHSNEGAAGSWYLQDITFYGGNFSRDTVGNP
jgi:hypothetical protein